MCIVTLVLGKEVEITPPCGGLTQQSNAMQIKLGYANTATNDTC